MAGKDIITMAQGELKRLHVIRKALDKHITQAEAADIIGVCLRQAQRIARRVKEEGDKGVIHKSRRRSSNRALPVKIKKKALRLYREKYNDFGPTLASEKLFEIDKIRINDETLRLWFIQENIPYKQRKKRPHRQWRERKHHFGEMIQIDGSHHDWFEGRGKRCVFMGWIDDATGRPFGRFYSYEGTIPAMDSFKRYIKKYGLPLSIYLDRHTTYKSTKKPSVEDELNDIEPLSQFGRAVSELGVNLIYAGSAQAKGRIERLFKTFQDRLIKEMRLKGIKSLEGANKFLPQYLSRYARRFAVKPANDTDMHRPISEDISLDKILCIKTKRQLRNDFTVGHNSKLYQIKDNVRTKKVVVEERVDGSMFITYRDRNLRFREITARPKKEQKEAIAHISKKTYIPAKDHPWRGFKLPGSINLKEKEKKLAGVL